MKESIFTKDQIKNFVKDIKKLKYDGHSKEKFAQVFYDGKPTMYLISSYGRVISTRYRGVPGRVRILKTKESNNGYLILTLCIGKAHKMCSIHRLVATAFIPNPKNKPEVNHKDGKKKHNYVWNLEWSTSKENIRHSLDNNLRHINSGEAVKSHVFTEKDVRKVCKLLVQNKLSMKEISEKTGVYYDIVRSIKNGNTWKNISKDYDFSHYTNGKSKREIERKEKAIRRACEMLESNKYTIKQISEKTGLSYGVVINISTGRDHVKISKDYKISNYVSKSNASKKEK